MTTGAANRVFLDTNILVYATMSQSPFHLAAQNSIQTLDSAGTELWISRQILREYLSVLTRAQALSGSLNPIPLIAEIELFTQQYSIAEDGPIVTSELLNLLSYIDTGGKQIHDANIVATMLSYDIRKLLTHNVSDFNRFSGIIEVVPL